MTKNLLIGLTGMLGLAVSSMAQMKTPVLGYVADGASIRVMSGIPASGSIGPAVPSSVAFATTAIAPEGGFAVALTAGDTQPVVVRLGGAEAQISFIEGVMPGADRIVLSPRASAALIGRSTDGLWQVVSGLPYAPAVTRNLESLGSVVAVSDDGQWVVNGSASGLTALGPDGQAIPLPVSGAISAVAFLNGGHSLVAADAASLTLIGDVDGGAGASVLSAVPADADPPATPESPTAVATSSDNRQVVVVGPSGMITHVDVLTGAVTHVDCQCSSAGLFGLGGNLFRLTGIDSGATKVLDAASDSVWFVPQALEVASGSAE